MDSITTLIEINKLLNEPGWGKVNRRCRLWDKLLLKFRNSPLSLASFIERNRASLLDPDELLDDLHMRAVILRLPTFRKEIVQ